MSSLSSGKLEDIKYLYENVVNGDQKVLSEDIDANALTSFNKPSQKDTKNLINTINSGAQKAKADRATQQRAELGVVKTNKGYIAKPGSTSYDPEKGSEAIKLANRLNKETGLGKSKAPSTNPNNNRNNVGGNLPPTAKPATSSTVLAKQGGVEGKLDKSTGKFTAGKFTGAETSRYASASASRPAAGAIAPKAPSAPAKTVPAASTPAIGKLGNTSFERRTPTSVELQAAQRARKQGASPEQALQAAQKTNLPTTGPTPAIPDMKSVSADLAKANANINKPAPAGTALAKYQASNPSSGTTAFKPAGAPKTPTELTQSYEYDDAYDVVLEYLLDTGHAETIAEAQYIMTELDQESIAEIAEQSIGSRAANAVGHQRAGTLGDDDEIRQNQDATSASIGKMKRGSGAKVTPTLPGV